MIIKTGASQTNTSKYTLNFSKKLLNNNSMFSLNMEGAIEGYSTHKLGLTYRRMY